MANKIYNVALIGCGSMGAAHLDDIRFMENAVIKCVCDLNMENAQRFKRIYHADYADTDYRISIAREDVDIKIISEGGLFKKAKVKVSISADMIDKYQKKAEPKEEIKERIEVKVEEPKTEEIAETKEDLV